MTSAFKLHSSVWYLKCSLSNVCIEQTNSIGIFNWNRKGDVKSINWSHQIPFYMVGCCSPLHCIFRTLYMTAYSGTFRERSQTLYILYVNTRKHSINQWISQSLIRLSDHCLLVPHNKSAIRLQHKYFSQCVGLSWGRCSDLRLRNLYFFV